MRRLYGLRLDFLNLVLDRRFCVPGPDRLVVVGDFVLDNDRVSKIASACSLGPDALSTRWLL